MRSRRILAAALAALVVVLAGCGVQPSSVLGGRRAPTGVAEGTPVYYVNLRKDLVVHRIGNNLGTIGQALKLLFTVDVDGRLRSFVPRSPVTLAFPVTKTREVITVMLPIDRGSIKAELGVDQIVCTVLAVHLQSGGPASTAVNVQFVQGFETGPRHCPVLPSG